MKRLTFLVFLVLSTYTYCKSQVTPLQVINSTGGSYSSGYYKIEWSVGELALVDLMSTSDSSVLFTNGFIQPVTQFPNQSNNYSYFTKDELWVFPNPVRDYLEINLTTQVQGKISLRLYDVLGKLVYAREVYSYGTGNTEKINMKAMTGGTYMLQITLKNPMGTIHKTGTFKIVKSL